MLNSRPNNSKYHGGLYVPTNKDKVIKLNEQGGIWYRSSWEKKILFYLDHNVDVIRYGCEFLEIPYMLTEVKDGFPVTSKHRYYPDFYYEMKAPDGSIRKVVAEVKPKTETLPPKPPKQGATRKQLMNFEYSIKMWNKNLSKWQFAVEYCKSKGVNFVIITEDFINKLSRVS